MNVEIGTKAALFPEKEYKNGIFTAVCLKYRRPPPANTGSTTTFLHFLSLSLSSSSGSCLDSSSIPLLRFDSRLLSFTDQVYCKISDETTTLSSNFLEATTSAAKTALEVAAAALGKYHFTPAFPYSANFPNVDSGIFFGLWS
jgi:hypothetical protein